MDDFTNVYILWVGVFSSYITGVLQKFFVNCASPKSCFQYCQKNSQYEIILRNKKNLCSYRRIFFLLYFLRS